MLTRPITEELRAEYLEAGLWADRPVHALVDAAASRDPAKLAIADPNQRLTYRELVASTRRLAAFLLAAGVAPGDAVAIQAPNSVHQAVVHLAANRVQAVFVPLHDSWTTAETHHVLATARAKVLFVAGRASDGEALGLELPELEVVVHLPAGLTSDLVPPVVDEAALDARLAGIPIDADAVRFTMISSGTTALPKVSGWSDNGLHALLVHNYARRSRLTDADIAVALAPIGTGATGYVFGVLAPLLVGATSVVQDPWDADAALDLIRAERATYAVAVPTQIIKLLESPRLPGGGFDALTRLSNGGAPLPEHRGRQAEVELGCRIHTMYGATDAGVPTMMDVEDPETKRVTTVGRVVDGVELRIVDDDGSDLGAGEPGHVVWRSADKFHGYLNNESATEAAFTAEGWYRSGDVGVLDDDGYLSIVGREKDMILRGGLNIFPGEIEELLSGHPAVAQVAVVGVPDPVLGERACAVVLPVAGSSIDLPTAVDFLTAAGLSKHKLPERLELVADLPVNAGGKVQKLALVEMLGGAGGS